MIIRSIVSTDIPQCVKLYCRVFSGFPWNESWNEKSAFRRLNHFFESKGFIGLLATEEDILGFLLGNTEPFQSRNLFYLREMCVAPEMQLRGIGKAMHQALENKLGGNDVSGIYLATRKTIPAAHFYARVGFNESAAMGFYIKEIQWN